MSPDLFSLQGKIALVTGGAQGLGRMIADGLLAAGASVYITSRKAAVCAAAARAMSGQGRRCDAICADVSTAEAVADLATRFRQAGNKRLDILVNNAGRTWGAPLESFPDKAWASVMAVNVQAPFKLVQELLPELTTGASAEDPARVINIGSIAGLAIEPMDAFSYGASKAALHHLTRQLATKLAARHVTVNAVLPGYFPTKITAHLRDGEAPTNELRARIPLARLGRPEDISGIVVFLASRAGSYVTGAEIPIDGGIAGCR